MVKGLGYSREGVDYAFEEEGGGLVKQELFSLEVIYPDEKMSPYGNYWEKSGLDKDAPFAPILDNPDYNPEVMLIRKNGTSFLQFYFYGVYQLWSDEEGIFVVQSPAETLVYKIKCPHIFKDEVEHEIVTYWRSCYPEIQEPIFERVCYRIEYEGKKIPHEQGFFSYENDTWVTATIVLGNEL